MCVTNNLAYYQLFINTGNTVAFFSFKKKNIMKNNYIPTILIIGAGPGGLLLYHGIQKHLNKNGKKFNIKIFEQDTCPQGRLLIINYFLLDRWQGYYIGVNPYGIRSLISCLPESLVARLLEVMPLPIHEKEY